MFSIFTACGSNDISNIPSDTQSIENALKTENFTNYSIDHCYHYTNQNTHYYKTVVDDLNYEFDNYDYKYDTLLSSFVYINNDNNYNYYHFDNSIDKQNYLFGYSQIDLSAIDLNLSTSFYLNLEQNKKSYNVFNYSLLNKDMFSYSGDGIFEVKTEYLTQVLEIFFNDTNTYNYIKIKAKVENNKLTELHITTTNSYTGEYHLYFSYDNIKINTPHTYINDVTFEQLNVNFKLNKGINAITENKTLYEACIFEGLERPYDKNSNLLDLAHTEKDLPITTDTIPLVLTENLKNNYTYTLQVAIHNLDSNGNYDSLFNIYRYVFKYNI